MTAPRRTASAASEAPRPAAAPARAPLRAPLQSLRWRRQSIMVVFALLGLGLVARAVSLQVFDHDFYRGQGDARQVRTVAIPAHRGMLTDRHGQPLAISTPIQTLWGNPQGLVEQPGALREVAAILSLDAERLQQRVETAAQRGRAFMYIKRHVTPDVADRVTALRVADLSVQREYRRYYPSGAAASHLIGFTDIDDHGREGLELAYDGWLTGSAGKRRILRDLSGREIAGMDIVADAVPGRDLRLSIDRQLQYFAEQALLDAVAEHRAESASVVVMDIASGEVLAMSNLPGYNPNDTADRSGGRQRNRALTDVFEPGSTMKPFTIAAALASGKYTADDIVYTSPGKYRIGKYVISDASDNGWLDLRGIVIKSSNVGVSKIATELEPEQMWDVFDRFGFGRPPGSAFPGEVAGYFNHPTAWHHVEQASVSYGYGISVSALQLVRAYAAIANDGIMPTVSFLAADAGAEVDAQAVTGTGAGAATGASAGPDAEPIAATASPARSAGVRVIDAGIARELQGMLEGVVAEGSGSRAAVPGYRVAGKTGTSHRSQSGGYAEDRYVSVFAGFAPVSDPRYAIAVVVHDPKDGRYFGSQVAAPVFSEVMGHALRLGAVEPDDVDELRTVAARAAPASPASPASLTARVAGTPDDAGVDRL